MEKMEYAAPKFEELESRLFLGDSSLDGEGSTGGFNPGDDSGDDL